MPDENDARSEDERRRGIAESLGFLVEQEARRFLSERDIAGDPQRIADGWERRFIADAQRAKEAMELYEELGYEVCADPVRAEDIGEDCEDCQLRAALRFVMVYTRRQPPERK